MSWQDLVLSVGSVIFVIALLPSVFSKDKPAVATSLMTASVLAVFGIVYASLGLWFTVVMTAITTALWLALFVQKLRTKE